MGHRHIFTDVDEGVAACLDCGRTKRTGEAAPRLEPCRCGTGRLARFVSERDRGVLLCGDCFGAEVTRKVS